MLVYKIAHKLYSTALIASGIDGRWTSGGRPVIYCADTIPLAFLENMVRRQGVGFNRDFNTLIVDIPDELQMGIIPPDSLAEGWRNFRDYAICQQVGNKWFDKMESPILIVPSAVMLSSNNYIINTNHPDFKKIRLAGITDLIPDERIEDILKSYKKK